MGNIFVRCGFAAKDTKLYMLGLDGAGKTTILYKLKLDEVVETIPTIGCNIEIIEYNKLKLIVWDAGGQDKMRPLWRFYFQNTHGLIFVIDSTDRERIDEAKEELQRLLQDNELKNAPLLVLANKKDLPNAFNNSEVIECLDLQKENRKWFVQSCCGTTGEGIYEGIDWLSRAIYPTYFL